MELEQLKEVLLKLLDFIDSVDANRPYSDDPYSRRALDYIDIERLKDQIKNLGNDNSGK